MLVSKLRGGLTLPKSDSCRVLGDRLEFQILGSVRKVEEASMDRIIQILIGVALLVGGGIATIVSYGGAAPGGTYVVWWGAMVFGVIEIFRGLSKS